MYVCVCLSVSVYSHNGIFSSIKKVEIGDNHIKQAILVLDERYHVFCNARFCRDM